MKTRTPPIFRQLLKTVLLYLAAWAAFVPALHAQQQFLRNPPHIGYIFPSGMQQGTTCEIVVGGQFLDKAKELLVSGSGVKVTVLKYSKPITQKRANELRDYLEEARKKMKASNENPFSKSLLKKFSESDLPEIVLKLLKESGATDDEIRGFMELRKERTDPKHQQNLQISETVTLKVEVAADAPTGPLEMRVLTPQGLSNPLAFCVGRYPEQIKPGPLGKTVDTAMRVALPTVLNGQILPGEVDHYAFQARKGARLVIAVQGRDLIPYLADAVPGWFQPVVTLSDANGKEVAYANDYRFSPDPVLCYEVPDNGIYLLEIKDALYRGREDFIYRITVGEVPFVTGIFPMGSPAGAACAVNAAGWNLPRSRVILKAAQEEGTHRVAELSNGFVVGDVAFESDTLPEITEKEPNNTLKEAQHVTLPVIINGHINAPGDVDVFAFSCEAGDKVVAEVVARRLNSPVDSWLKVTDETGLQIAFNDDMDDKGSALLTHQADSYVTFTAPASGRYHVSIGDSQHNGGPEYGYRLRISLARPDFALRIVPSSLNARPGAAVPVTVYALRKDGFKGDVTLALKDAPEGFALQGGYIPAGQDKVRATVTFPQELDEKPVALAVEGRALVAGRQTTRPVVPADDMLQAFIYHHLVPSSALYAAAKVEMGRGNKPMPQLVNPEPVMLVPGSSVKALLAMPGRGTFFPSAMKLELSEPPEGVSVEGISRTPEGISISFRTDAKVKPGLRGNLILEAFYDGAPPFAPAGKKADKIHFPLGFLPAIPFRVIGPAAVKNN